jgi:N-sulfoglucosamine sulfohydrolase
MQCNSIFTFLTLCPAVFTLTSCSKAAETKPNILFVISDDQSWPFASAYGSKCVTTPAFDRVAKMGCLFTNAYVTSPGCSPSRASLLTGLYPWQIEEAGTHASSFPSRYLCFPEILEQHGYHTGFTGKGWAPGNWKVSGRKNNPAGTEYNDAKLTPPYKGISSIDYFTNFRRFLSERSAQTPFCFWLGGHEPHRNFEAGSWIKEGYSLTKAEVPSFLPDSDLIRGDILDYAVEIEWFDKQLMKCIEFLDSLHELDNTLIIVTSDNGMAFPDAKANCYDAGIHVPMAICWGNHMKGSQIVDALVSTVNIAPTLFNAAGILVKNPRSGESLLPLMTGEQEKYKMQAVFAGRERHSFSRYNNLGYPVRAMRWKNYLLVHNFKPGLWPAGDPTSLNEKGDFETGFAYFDIDDSPSKTYLIDNRENPGIRPYFEASTEKRPEYQLFDLSKDAACMNNLALDKAYSKVLDQLKRLLHEKLVITQDPRTGLNHEIWETYPRLEGKMRNFPKP